MCWNILCNFFHSKPPQVVFIFTLVTCTFSLLGILVHVDINKLWLTDPNVRDWNSFYGKLSMVQFCVPTIGDPASKTQQKRDASSITPDNSTKMASAKVLVNMKFMKLEVADEKLSEETGNIKMLLADKNLQLVVTEEMLGKRVHFGEKAREVLMTISVPYQSKTNSNEYSPVCMLFEGPSELLPDSTFNPATCNIKKSTLIPATVHPSSPAGCNGTVYGMALQQEKILTPLLDEDSIKNIEQHLMHTTLLLLLFIASILACSLCGSTGGANREKNTQGSRMRLPSIGGDVGAERRNS